MPGGNSGGGRTGCEEGPAVEEALFPLASPLLSFLSALPALSAAVEEAEDAAAVPGGGGLAPLFLTQSGRGAALEDVAPLDLICALFFLGAMAAKSSTRFGDGRDVGPLYAAS